MICWHRIKIITLFPISDASWCTHHLVSFALDGGKLLVLTLWNWVRTRCYAPLPDTEMLICIVRTLRILFIDGHIRSYLGSFELLKIWCFVQDICTHLMNVNLNCVRNALNRNSTVRIHVFDGSGIDYVHWRRWKEQQWCCSESMSKLIYKCGVCLP
jgi:hypothetical protein